MAGVVLREFTVWIVWDTSGLTDVDASRLVSGSGATASVADGHLVTRHEVTALSLLEAFVDAHTTMLNLPEFAAATPARRVLGFSVERNGEAIFAPGPWRRDARPPQP